MRIAIYPGSFDPLTWGHMDVIDRASGVFDRVIVAVGRNSQKEPMMPVDKRLELIRETCASRPEILADSFDGLVVEYARAQGAVALIRGLRAVSDFDYEFQMSVVNRSLAPGIATVFFMPSQKHIHITSTIVREVARYNGPLESLVPPAVAKAIRA